MEKHKTVESIGHAMKFELTQNLPYQYQPIKKETVKLQLKTNMEFKVILLGLKLSNTKIFKVKNGVERNWNAS